MNVAQKRAWFRISVSTISLLAFVVLLLIAGVKVALAAFSIFSLLSLELFLFRKKKSSNDNEVDTDERDTHINRQAGVVAGAISYLSFFVICWIIWAIYRHQATVPIGVLFAIQGTGAVILLLSHSILLLIGYGRETSHEES
jgi:uncharacterized membrane protein YqjE